MCGWFSFLALVARVWEWKNYQLLVCMAMSSQFMNSILYLAQYLIECKTPSSVNYDTLEFPCGFYFYKRPFMYINVLWFIMPSIILIKMIFGTYS